MKTCWRCGAYVPDAAKFCRDCGANLAEENIDQGSAMDPEDRTVILKDPEDKVEHWQAEPEYHQAERRQPEYRQAEPEYRQPERRQLEYQQAERAAAQPYTYSTQTPEWDHTAEFDPKDISDNKVVAMLVYLMGWIGIIIALLGGATSPYAAFHVRQGLKFVVLNCMIAIVGAVVSIVSFPFGVASTIFSIIKVFSGTSYDMGITGLFSGLFSIIWGLLVVFAVVLGIVKIICFFDICKGKAKEPPIVRMFKFLR